MKAIVIFLCFTFSVCQAEVVDKIVAVINNEIVTESDIKSFSKKIDKNGFLDEMLLLGKSVSELKKNRGEQLEYMINEKILDSEIKRLNLLVTSERVDQEIRNIAKKNGIGKSELLNTIKNQGISVSEYQNFVKMRVERQSLVETEITSKISVSDEDVLGQYMRTYPDSSSGVYEFTLSHIYFNPRKGGAEQAFERAQNVLKKIRSGESFEVLAEQHSEDTNFSTGGALGTFKAGEFAKEMEGAVSSLNIGEVSEIVKSKTGFHVLKVNNKKIVSDPRFEKEKEKIRSQLFEKSFQKHFRNWLQSKREESFIRINK
jgi:peptidyl-prolyl cis-trans isomerase SurA